MAFCVIPWLHRQTNEQGFHQLCCVGVGESNQLHDSAGRPLHVSQKLTDEQVLNSPDLKRIRKQMSRGSWPPACERCRQAEQAGSVSIRQQLNDRFDRGREKAMLDELRSDGSLPNPVVRYADIRLGNVCNLTCRMCGPVASRLWTPYFNQVQPSSYRLTAEALAVLSEHNWVKRESVAWLLAQCLPGLESLHFAGGEPLIIPEMVEALEYCVRSGRAGEIDLSYNTNLTVLPERVTELWPHFRSVSLLCSIDGYGPLNDYIRRQSRWSAIDQNLRMLDANFHAWKIGWAAVSATVQIYNALSISDLFAYLRSAGFANILSLPQLVPLFDPRYLSIQALPASAKKLARDRLEGEIERAEDFRTANVSGIIGSVRSTIAFMDAADTHADLADFLAFSEASDRAFGDSWRNAAPELASHLEHLNRDCLASERGKVGIS